MRKLLDFRTVWPYLVNDAASALQAASPQPELLATDLSAIQAIPPEERRLVELERLQGSYVPPEGSAKRRIKVTMDLQFTFAAEGQLPHDFINRTVGEWLRDNADRADVPYIIVKESVSVNPTALTDTQIPPDGDAAVPAPNANNPNANQPPRIGPANAGGGAKPPATARPDAEPGKALPPGQKVGIKGAGGGSGETVSKNGDDPGSMPTPGAAEANIDASSLDLETLAPVPVAPALLPPGAKVYHLPVTFEVELRDEPAPAAKVAGTTSGEDSNT